MLTSNTSFFTYLSKSFNQTAEIPPQPYTALYRLIIAQTDIMVLSKEVRDW